MTLERILWTGGRLGLLLEPALAPAVHVDVKCKALLLGAKGPQVAAGSTAARASQERGSTAVPQAASPEDM